MSALVLFLPFSFRFFNSFSSSIAIGVVYVLSALAILNTIFNRRILFRFDQIQTCLFIFVTYIFLQYLGSHFGLPVKSIYAYATRQEFLRLFSFFMLIQLLVAYGAGHRSMVWWILGSALAAAYGVSFFSIYRLFFGSAHLQTSGLELAGLLDWFRIHPNRNNAAAFLELMTPVALSVTYYRFKHGKVRAEGSGQNLITYLLIHDHWFLLSLNVSLTILIGAIANLSKFSLVSLAFGGLVFFVLLNQNKRSSKNWIAFSIVGAIGLLIAFYVSGGALSSRFSQASAFDWQTLDMRVPFWQRAFPLSEKFLWFGSGLGTFSEVMVGFHRVTLHYFSQHLLNDYLELGIEVGMIGLLIYGVFWFFLFMRLIPLVIREKSFFRRYVSIGLIAGLSSFLLRHLMIANFYDFTNSFFAFLSVGLLLTLRCETQGEEFVFSRNVRQKASQAVQKYLAISILGIALMLFTRQQLAVAFLGKNPIEMSYKRAFAIDSENADYPYELSRLYWNRAVGLTDPSRRMQKLREAQIRLAEAIRINPFHLKYRIDFSEAALLRNEIDAGDQIFEFLQTELPFDSELLISRGLYWAKVAEMSSGDVRENALTKAAFYFNSVSSQDSHKSDYLNRLKEKRLSILNASLRSEISEFSS